MNEELTPLEALINLFKYACNYKVDENHRLGNSKEWKDIVKKSLKALEIIKKKGFSTNEIAFIKEGDSWETYIETMKELYWGDESLDKVLKTHEEYDLLKEVLKND